MVAEIVAIKEKAQRFLDGVSTMEEVGASTPMLTTIASEIGYLKVEQVVSFRRAITLDLELRKTSDILKSRKKASSVVIACDDALKNFA